MAKLTLDFRLWELDYELWAVGEHLETVEMQIARLEEDDRNRMWVDLQLSGAADDEVERDIALQQHTERVGRALPRLFRGAYVVVLWAVFEAGVDEIASFLREQRNKKLKLSDIKGDLLDRANKYWDQVLESPFCPDSMLQQRLATLLVVRNVFAHGNGRISSVRSDQRARLLQLVTAGIGLEQYLGFVYLSEAFVRHSYSAVRDTLEPLITLVRSVPQRAV